MEWNKDLQSSSSQLNESWNNNMPTPQFNVGQSSSSSNNVEWSFEENKVFENALAEQDEIGPDFFKNLATLLPYKSMHDIMTHFEALLKDVDMIESGLVPIPDYKTQENASLIITEKMAEENENENITEKMAEENENENETETETKDKNEKSSVVSNETKKTSSVFRRRGVPWTEEEHQLFLMGLNKYGKGDWRSISRYYVTSKTPTQIASHAQKYFRRQTSTTPMDRRRPSIHDIKNVASVASAGTNMPLSTFTINSSAAAAYPGTNMPLAIVTTNSLPAAFPGTNMPLAIVTTNSLPAAYPGTYMPLSAVTTNSSSAAYPGTYMPLYTFASNFSSAPAPAQMPFQRTTAFMNNSMSGVTTNTAQMPFQFQFQRPTAFMNNSMTGVSTNLEQNPAMFVPDDHVNSAPQMPSSSMNNQQWFQDRNPEN